jgi:hypothetical protein
MNFESALKAMREGKAVISGDYGVRLRLNCNTLEFRSGEVWKRSDEIDSVLITNTDWEVVP